MTTHTEPSEEWRPVVGWEGLYEVSDQGRVRSLDRVVAFGAQQRLVRGRILKGGKTVNGVPFVVLSNGEHVNRSRHRLVLEAFVGPCPPGMEACHWNDIKTDNRLANLRWDTHAANGRDCVRNGNHKHANKTHCPRNHEYTPENTKRMKHGGRACMECHRIDGRERYRADIENQRILKRDSMRRRRQAKREQVA